MYTDNWVRKASGNGIHNYPELVEGVVEEEWATTEYDYRRMSTGKVYKRRTVYYPQSPYGWELIVI